MKNTFLTTKYRDGFIHSCYNTETKREEFTAQYRDLRVQFNSLRAAQQAILSWEPPFPSRVVSLTTEPTQFAKL